MKETIAKINEAIAALQADLVDLCDCLFHNLMG